MAARAAGGCAGISFPSSVRLTSLLRLALFFSSAVHGLVNTPPMGFSHWAIETCNATMPSAAFFKSTADQFVRLGLRDAGYEFLQIDDCWMLPQRGSAGQQIPDPSKFPDGMQSLADYVHESGLKLGIYTAMGTNTCAKKAGSCGAFKVDTAQYASWGMDYLKVDSCGGCTSPMNDTAVIRADLTATGRPFVMQVHPSTNVSIVSANPEKYGNTRIPGRDMFEAWTSMVSSIDGAAGLWQFAHNDTGKGGFFNELDILVGMGDFADDVDRIRSFFGMAVIMKSALMLSTVVQDLSPAALAVIINSEAISINQDPWGIAGRRIASIEPNDRSMAAPFDALLVLAVCNASSTMQKWRLNETDSTLWTKDDDGRRWCVGPSELSWTRPLAVLPCDDPRYRKPVNGSDNCHVTTCNYVSGFKTAPVKCTGMNASHCQDPHLGGAVGEGCTIRLKCKPGGVIAGVKFADFGLVEGEFGSSSGSSTSSCSSFQSNASCTTDAAKRIVEDLCVGKEQCDVLASADVFGDPCRHVHKRLAIWATGCSPDLASRDPQYVILPSTIAGADSLTWENVEFGTGPLPHTRYIGGGTASSGYWTTSEAGLRSNEGVMMQAGYGRVRDDDGTGRVLLADAAQYCVEATRGGNLETWWAPLSGGRHALALFNRSPSADVIAVAWKQLPGLQPSSRVSVRDVWLKEDTGVHSEGFRATVPAHGTSLFVLTPV